MSELYEFELPNGFLYAPAEEKPRYIRNGYLRGLSTADFSYLRDTIHKGKWKDTGWTPVDEVIKRNIVDLGGETNPAVIKGMYESYLWAADSIYLLVETKRFGVSDGYAWDDECSKCGKKIRPRIKLSGLEIDEAPEEHRGKAEYTLPVTHDVYGDPLDNPLVITFGPLLAKHAADLRAIGEDHPEARAEKETALQVKKINDKVVTSDDIAKLSLRQYLAISAVMETVCGGLKFKVDYLCKHRFCGKESELDMPINIRDFLLPGKQSGVVTGEATPSRLNGDGGVSSRLNARVSKLKKSPTENSSGISGTLT